MSRWLPARTPTSTAERAPTTAGHSKGSGAERTLGPIARAPFYAVEVGPSTIGTNGGPKTNADGQVLSVDGEPIEGLYAAGNTMASVMGSGYSGAGATLGPALVFGVLAGRHAAARTRVPA